MLVFFSCVAAYRKLHGNVFFNEDDSVSLRSVHSSACDADDMLFSYHRLNYILLTKLTEIRLRSVQQSAARRHLSGVKTGLKENHLSFRERFCARYDTKAVILR